MGYRRPHTTSPHLDVMPHSSAAAATGVSNTEERLPATDVALIATATASVADSRYETDIFRTLSWAALRLGGSGVIRRRCRLGRGRVGRGRLRSV